MVYKVTAVPAIKVAEQAPVPGQLVQLIPAGAEVTESKEPGSPPVFFIVT